MNFRQLEVFVSIVDYMNFSKVAKKLYLSQPTVSAQLKSLEDELQTQLVKRSTKAVEITSNGKKAYLYAKQILELRDKFTTDFSKVNEERIYIGASSVPGQIILPKLLVKFYEQETCEFRTHFGDSMEIIEKVKSGILDLGLVGTKVEDSQLKFEKICNDELVFITPNTEYYRALDECEDDMMQLLGERILMRESSSGTCTEIMKFFADKEVKFDELDVLAYTNDSGIVVNSVIEGLGISIISRKLIEPEVAKGRLLAFSFPNEKLYRDLYVCYTNTPYMPPLINKFINFIRKNV